MKVFSLTAAVAGFVMLSFPTILLAQNEPSDDVISVGFQVPLFKDRGDLNNDGMTVDIYKHRKQYGYEKIDHEQCSGGSMPGLYNLPKSGECVDVLRVIGDISTENLGKYCSGQSI